MLVSLTATCSERVPSEGQSNEQSSGLWLRRVPHRRGCGLRALFLAVPVHRARRHNRTAAVHLMKSASHWPGMLRLRAN